MKLKDVAERQRLANVDLFLYFKKLETHCVTLELPVKMIE